MRQRFEGRAGKFVSCLVVAVVALIAPRVLTADLLILQVDAQAGDQGASYAWALPKNLDANGHQTWNMSSPLTLVGANGVIGTIDQLSLTFSGDPGVSLSFSYTAGGVDTLFGITSLSVGFPAIVNPLAYASAGITLTDTDGNGASIVGEYPGGKCYEAHYNAADTVYTQIIDSFSAAAETTEVRSQRDPLVGRTGIVGSVDRIQSQFWFTLSANDQASGTSRFDVQPIPEPATLLLVGSGVLGLAGVIRRRRMK